jgi:hypothetical protein
MTSKKHEVRELEGELLRLNTLVRERREQLARLEHCPNPQCPCRVVWRDHVEKGLSEQVNKIRKQVRPKSARAKRSAPALKKQKARKAA